METSRLFILGAGFSKQAGMPLATELTDLILERFKQHGQKEMLEWFHWLKQRIDWLEKTSEEKSSGINIEQVFDLALFDVLLWKIRQHTCPLGRTGGDTPYQAAVDIEAWLTYLEGDLTDVIVEKQEKALQRLHLISRFSKHLQARDVVVTFNYDTLLEESLSKESKLWHYGFKQENGPGIEILKMHGSINWFAVPRGQSENFGYPLLFRKTDQNRDPNDTKPIGETEYDYEMVRCPDKSLKQRIQNRDLQSPHKQYSIGIAGLGSYKPLDKLPGSGEIWFKAGRNLFEAEEIYIIGFSLSPFDNMARLHFADVMCQRAEKKNLPILVLIDPYARRLEPNFRSVFGDTTRIRISEQKAEHVDWDKLLAC